MPKLRGKAKKAFLARMAKGRRKAHGGGRKKTTHHRHKKHGKRFGSMAHMLSGGNPSTAKAVKQVVDKMSHEMSVMKKKLEKECATAVRKASKSHPSSKKKRRSKKGHGRKKSRSKKSHARKSHPRKGHGRKKVHHVRDVSARRYGSKSVTALSIVKGAKNKTWTCAGPRRTGCGGGSKGGHVVGRVRR